jgi:hypothetical protein
MQYVVYQAFLKVKFAQIVLSTYKSKHLNKFFNQ